MLHLTTSCPENRPTEKNVNDPQGGTNVLIHENHALVWAASVTDVSVTSKAMGTYSTVCSYFENGLLCMACLLLLLAACSMLTSLWFAACNLRLQTRSSAIRMPQKDAISSKSLNALVCCCYKQEQLLKIMLIAHLKERICVDRSVTQ